MQTQPVLWFLHSRSIVWLNTVHLHLDQHNADLPADLLLLLCLSAFLASVLYINPCFILFPDALYFRVH